jgi:thiamine transport system ATP-binding protein
MLNIERLQFSYLPQSTAQYSKSKRSNETSKEKGITKDALAMCFDLSVNAGEVLSLIGPSGSGKSTLLKLIAGFLPASKGKIEIEIRNQKKSQAIQLLQPAKRPVTMLFQEHNLFPHLDIYTNIALGINPSLTLTAQQNEAIDQALESLGLEDMQKRSPGSLSGGQRQRVALARALVRQHPILLLDEPFAALGPAQREEMIGLVKEMVEDKNMCALLVSHQPSDALLASRRTAFINNGQVIKIDETKELLNQSGLAEINQYLGT